MAGFPEFPTDGALPSGSAHSVTKSLPLREKNCNTWIPLVGRKVCFLLVVKYSILPSLSANAVSLSLVPSVFTSVPPSGEGGLSPSPHLVTWSLFFPLLVVAPIIHCQLPFFQLLVLGGFLCGL